MIHASALVWLLLGLIVVIALNNVPKQTSISPLIIQCVSPVIAIDLGIDPFWLSLATFTFTGSSTLYVANVSREDTPTETIDDAETLFPPYYLARGSNYSATNQFTSSIEFWFIKSEPRNCNNVEKWNCSDPLDDNKICEKTKSREATSLYTVNVSNYYTFCVNPANVINSIRQVLNLVKYNLTAIQERSIQRVEMSSAEKTVNLNMSKWFDFHKEDMSIFLHTDAYCNELPLKIEVHRRKDILYAFRY